MAGLVAAVAQRYFEKAARIEDGLRAAVSGEVRFDSGSRALYSTDASNYRQIPIGIVIPRDAGDVARAVEACKSYGLPILPRGCGTSLAGQCCNTAVILDCSKYFNRILQVDAKRRRARVQPGVVVDSLNKAAGPYGLKFGPDPATHDHCTLGGMIGNNSCGIHSVQTELSGKGAMTRDNVSELEILTYDGLQMRVGPTSETELERIIRQGGRRSQIYAGLKRIRDRYGALIRNRFPNIPRRASGYSLEQLLPENGFNVARALVGSEGTCVTVLEATIDLVKRQKHRTLLVLGYPDVFAAADHVPELRRFSVIGLEGMDETLIRYMQKKRLNSDKLELLPEGRGWLLAEFGGDTPEEAREAAEAAMRHLDRQGGAPNMRIFEKKEEAHHIWLVRESGLGATALVPNEPDTWEGWEDSAVPPERIGEYLRKLRGLFEKYGYRVALYGHFGQGCVHCRVGFDLVTAAGIAKYRRFVDEASDLVLSLGGALSGEHGDGQARGELLSKMYGPELVQAFREFKTVWDPDWKMNPGKLIDADPITQNLRLGTDYDPPDVKTHFQYPQDSNSFARAAQRCVGVGACRRLESGTMCPSFMVTREEKHSTRGRARLLFELLRGNALSGGWRNEAVKEALDLCLACKGCKSECPVNVDMATYKAEFMAHYYEGRLRPRQAYALGWVQHWVRFFELAPSVANFITQTPGLRRLAKAMAGVAPERQIPPLAPQTFRAWFESRKSKSQSGQRVLLWVDTFNNHFTPETSKAAVEVLEAAGFRVEIPTARLCCGRPLYDFGMLHAAKERLAEVLSTLRPALREGVPLVGLEPSCTAVFRDEVVNLFPNDLDARRLKEQTFTLGELLAKKAPHWTPPRLDRKALLHGHCHHKTVLDFESDARLVRQAFESVEVPDTGCCGLAGSFGYEKEKYAVSVKAGERALLPAITRASDKSLIITDGFSCRSQVEHLSVRRALHTAEALRLAIRQEPLPECLPELVHQRPIASAARGAAITSGIALAAVAGYLAIRRYVA